MKTLDNGVYRDATPAEIAEAQSRANEPRPVPQRVPMLNAHLVLIESGWMPALRAHLDAMTGPAGEMARVYFDKAQTMARDNALVLSIPDALGKTEAEVDQLFIMAGELDV